LFILYLLNVKHIEPNCFSNQYSKALRKEAGIKRYIGLLTYFLLGRLPICQMADSGKVCLRIMEDYSSGYCAGFSPASLLSVHPVE